MCCKKLCYFYAFTFLGNIEDLIDDDDDDIDDDINLYRQLDNERPIQIDDEIEGPESNLNDKKRGFIYPLRVVNQELSHHVNLLLTEKDNILHYSTIKNFNGFLRAQYNKNNSRYFYCYSCLHGFKAKKGEKTREDCKLLKEHIRYCKTQKPQRVSYPKDKELEFTNIQTQLKHPFVGYADFECILKKETDIDVKPGITSTIEKELKYQTHDAASYFTKFVSIDSSFTLDEDEHFSFPPKKQNKKKQGNKMVTMVTMVTK